MKIEVVGMNRNAFVFKPDDDLDAFAFRARREVQQRMFVETELGEYAVEARVGVCWHIRIVKESLKQVQETCTFSL